MQSLSIQLYSICLIITTVVSRPSEGLGPRHYASERTFSHDDTCGYVNGQGKGIYFNPDLEIGGACCSVNRKCGQFWVELSNLSYCIPDYRKPAERFNHTGSMVEFCGRGCREGYGECFNHGRGFGRGCGLEHSNAHCQPGICCSEFE